MERLVYSCVSGMIKYGVIEKRHEAVIEYGLDLLFSSVLEMVTLLIMGTILHKGIYTICLLLTFIPLQSFGGDFHCQTHLRCFIMMIIGYLFSVYVLAELPVIVSRERMELAKSFLSAILLSGFSIVCA